MHAPRSPRFVIPAVLTVLAAATMLGAYQEGAAPRGLLDRFHSPALSKSGSAASLAGIITTPGRFDGYTNYWHDVSWTWSQYGNLFQMGVPDVGASILQTKADIAEELGVPGLAMAEGFLSAWLAGPLQSLDNPSRADLEKALAGQTASVAVFAPLTRDLGPVLFKQAASGASSAFQIAEHAHQRNALDYREARAFVLEDGPRRLFAVLADESKTRDRIRALLAGVENVTKRYDLHRGWFGASTLLHSVTCFPGHPLEVLAKGMGQGNDWFTFNGYMDFMLQKQLPEWLGRVGLDVVTDVGSGKASHSLGTIAYGLREWDGFKLQDMPTEEEWIQFVKDRGGYLFRPVFAPDCDKFQYNGSIAIDGNKKQIDGEDTPFILQTGFVREDAPAFMVLFTPKGEPFSRPMMWKAILDRREVGVMPQARMMGPQALRNALQMLWLDRVWLEDYFGDAIQLAAETNGRTLSVRVRYERAGSLDGALTVRTGPELAVTGEARRAVALKAGAARTEDFALRLTKDAMGRANPILVQFEGAGVKKRTLAVLDMPPAVSVQKLLYGQAPAMDFPVSVHNFSDRGTVDLTVKIDRTGSGSGRVYEKTVTLAIAPGSYKETVLRLPLPPGSYTAAVSAVGTEAKSQIGIEAASGSAVCTPVDLNGDGIMEYRLENKRVRATLLATGARVIEYIVKDKGDNVFFKLWPEKEVSTDKRPFRERGFYPYGGFEDFLGQASIETHKIYSAEVLQASGPYVQVRMTADYFGNRLEKVFTLYGDSPLLEVRFALEFRNPELHMIGPQPILELGKRHWTEDLFVVPGLNGLEEYRMRPEEYFGRVLNLKEGWNAGYDTEEDIAFVGAYPVSEPEFLHMWMNHPSNGESNHYYAEFQPWVPIFQKTVRYFSYYMWASSGDWKTALEEMRRRNLITTR
jgi:hypothetical protein